MLDSGYYRDRYVAKLGRKSPFLDRGTNIVLDQVPRLGNFATDKYSRRVERIYDRRQAKSEITSCGLQCGESPAVITASSRNKVLDRKF